MLQGRQDPTNWILSSRYPDYELHILPPNDSLDRLPLPSWKFVRSCNH
jgi:hypothetical protein